MGFGAFRTTCHHCGYQAATTGEDCPRCGARQGRSDGQAVAGGAKTLGWLLWLGLGPIAWYGGCQSSEYALAGMGVVVTLIGMASMGR